MCYLFTELCEGDAAIIRCSEGCAGGYVGKGTSGERYTAWVNIPEQRAMEMARAARAAAQPESARKVAEACMAVAK